MHLLAALLPHRGPVCLPGRNLIASSERARNRAETCHRRDEPPRGEPDVEEITAALRELDTDLFVVVEQDMYPAPFDRPKPIAQRTRRYLRGVGIGAEAGGQP